MGRLGSLFNNEVRPPVSLTKLERLDVSGCNWVDDALVAELAALPKLKKLTLRELPRLTDQGISEVARMPQLQSLTIGENRQITGAGLAALWASLPRLKSR